MSCEAVGRVLFTDDDIVRRWYERYRKDGIQGLKAFNHEGGDCPLTAEQREKPKAWVAAALPRTTREVGAWIERVFGVPYESRSGLIKLPHRLGVEHRKPKAISRKLDRTKQEAFIKAFAALSNQLSADEAAIFADAVRPVGCPAPRDVPVAVEQSSGRQRLNIHGAIGLETGQTVMNEGVR